MVMAEEKTGEFIIKVEDYRTPTMIREQISADGNEKGGVLKEEEKQQQWLKKVMLDQQIDTTERPSASECCIFTVPKALLELKDKKAAYIPQFVCLGPYHFLKYTDLDYMEKIKSEVVRSIRTRLNTFLPEQCSVFKIVEEIKRKEKMITECYDRQIVLTTEVLAWMMARDAIFILQFLRQRVLHTKEFVVREIESLPLVDTLKDIAKLENQIPLLVLQIAHNHIYEKWDNVNVELDGILESMCSSLSPIGGANSGSRQANHILERLRSHAVGDADEQRNKHDHEKFNNFDAFVYHAFQCLVCIIYIILSPCIWKSKIARPTILPPAVKLHKAGVKFKPRVDGIQAIRFDQRRSTLYLPHIKVDIHTETIMRNIMAFELCSSSCKDKPLVTRYAHLMDQLINTEKDVALLSKYDIIRNKLENDSKVADFWNSLDRLHIGTNI